MALRDNYIDVFQFLWLKGQSGPEPPKMRLAIDERDGVTGHEILKLGLKGQPFTLRSGVDVVDYEAARAQHADYVGMIEEVPVELIVGGVSSNSQNYLVKVIDVRLVYAGSIGGSVGGFLDNPGGYVECDWDLLPIPLTPT